MTTRSKKRLQTSLSENSAQIIIPKSERKTRSQRIKDCEEFNLTLPKLKKRNNYVTYPSTDEETKENNSAEAIVSDKHERKTLRSTLKEQNIGSVDDADDNETSSKRSTRLTRRGRKSFEKQSVDKEKMTLDVNNDNIDVTNMHESVIKQSIKKVKGHKTRKISKTVETKPDLIPEVENSNFQSALETSKESSIKKFKHNKSKMVVDDAETMETDEITISVEENNHNNEDDQVSLQLDTKSRMRKKKQHSKTLQIEMTESVLAEENMKKTLENASEVTDSTLNSTQTKKSRKYIKVRKSHIPQDQTSDITVNDQYKKHSFSPFVIHPDIINNFSGELNASKTKTSKKKKPLDILKEDQIDGKEKKPSMKIKDVKNTQYVDEKPQELFQDMGDMNKSDMSVEAFDGAAGSSTKKLYSDNSFIKNTMVVTEVNSPINAECKATTLNNTFNETTGANRASLKDSTYDKIDSSTPKLKLSDDKNALITPFAATKVKTSLNDKCEGISPNNTLDSKNESKGSSIRNSTYDKIDVFTPKLNSTYNKNSSSAIINITDSKDNETNSVSVQPEKLNGTYDITPQKQKHSQGTVLDNNINNEEKQVNTTFDKNIVDNINKSAAKESQNHNETFDKSNEKEGLNSTYDKDNINNSSCTNNNLNTSYDNKPKSNNSTFEIETVCNTMNGKGNNIPASNSGSTTFDHETNSLKHTTGDITKNDENPNNTGVKISTDKDQNSRSSLISSDASTIAGNITDDNSVVNISEDSNFNNIFSATPIMIESSINESNINETYVENNESFRDRDNIITNDELELSRTKDNSQSTPEKQTSLPAPGLTPYNSNHKSSQKIKQLNMTHSIEKSMVSDEQPRATKVMFCSPLNNPEIQSKRKSKIVKSSLKGSNKSFLFEQNEVSRPGVRKRSWTHSEAQERAKRTRLADELQHSVDRLSRPRTFTNEKQPEQTTPNRKIAKRESSSDTKVRNKARALPNFAALHRKNFDKMESIADFKERKAKRARQLLTPTGKLTVLERSPQDELNTQEKPSKAPAEPPQVPSLMSLRPGYTRFGFKLNIDVNPFVASNKPEAKKLRKTELKRPPTMPSLSGVTTRKDYAKNTIMREKSFTSAKEKREGERNEYRSIIKGVRTNRRFELQMKSRNINN